MNKLGTEPYRGTRDFYPADQRVHNYIFGKLAAVAEGYGYEPVNGPMLEDFGIYEAKSGQELANEQLYRLEDKKGRSLAIRPEMTPTVARMIAKRSGELVFPVRWYSTPNLWRYERPQRGRLREHWQFNVDIIGAAGAMAEAEVIQLACDMLRSFGAGAEDFRISINNRRFANAFLCTHVGLSREQSVAALRMVDRKDKVPAEEFLAGLATAGLDSKQIDGVQSFLALTIADVEKHAALEGAAELRDLFQLFRQYRIDTFCRFSPSTVRGIDYYTGTVMEMFDTSPKNTRAMFGGGRYDNLVGLFQKTELSGFGFGLGDVTMQRFLEEHNLLPGTRPNCDVLMTNTDPAALAELNALAAALRKSGIRTETYLDGTKGLTKQLQYASRKQIPLVAILGEEERRKNVVGIKNLVTREQSDVPTADAPSFVKAALQALPDAQAAAPERVGATDRAS